jgi:thiaminase
MFLVAGPLESRQYANKQLDRHPYQAWIDRYRLDQNQRAAHRQEHDL